MAAPAANPGGYCIIRAAGWLAIGEGVGGAGGCRNRRSPALRTVTNEARAGPAPPAAATATGKRGPRGAAVRGAGRAGGQRRAGPRPPSLLPPCRGECPGGRRAWERMMQSAGGPGSPPPVKSRLGSAGHPRAPHGRGRRSSAAERPPGCGPPGRAVASPPQARGGGAGRARSLRWLRRGPGSAARPGRRRVLWAAGPGGPYGPSSGAARRGRYRAGPAPGRVRGRV